ncbi:hypothetical protein P7C70_g9525, partial [Phenoliferia sp. Uapishka_3]
MQVAMAQLASNQSSQASTSVPFAPRKQYYPPADRPTAPAPQNRYAGRWSGGSKPRDSAPHESNNATYESNFAASGSNSTPVGGGLSANQWGKRPEGSTMPTYQTRTQPQCLWCAGEDGEHPHWMNACASMQEAIVSGVVRKDNEGKIRYGMRYVPSRAHPRGMRAWVNEQEALAKSTVKEQNVRFLEAKVNSIEYEGPEISEGSGEYDATHIQVDEFEVNQTKRARSASPENPHPKKVTRTSSSRPKQSQFEDSGYKKGTRSGVDDEDEEMTDAPRRRQPRAKLSSAIESKSNPQEYLDRFLEQPITLPMNMM